MVGQPVGAGVEFGVGEALAFEHDGGVAGGLFNLPLEQADNRLVLRVVRFRAVPGDQLLALRLGQQRQGVDRPVGVGGGGLQQRLEMPGQALDGGGVEQVGGVFPVAVQLAFPLFHVQGQVELGDRIVLRQRLGVQARQGQFGDVVVLQREHDLEQRAMAGAALRPQALDQGLEREVLAGVGGEAGFADLGEQAGEGLAGRQADAQDKGVDEEADQVFGLMVGAVGDGRTDAEVVLTAVAGEQHAEGGEQSHEQGRAVLLG